MKIQICARCKLQLELDYSMVAKVVKGSNLLGECVEILSSHMFVCERFQALSYRGRVKCKHGLAEILQFG